MSAARLDPGLVHARPGSCALPTRVLCTADRLGLDSWIADDGETGGGHTRRVRRWVWVSSALAPVSLIGGWLLAESRQPAAFSPVTDTISALAATGTPERWIMTTGLVVLGTCHIATALGLPEARAAGRALLGVGGVATLAVAALPQPADGHFVAATASFVALAVWPVAAHVPGRTAARLATLGLGALNVWLAVELRRDMVVGLSERVVAGAEALWPLAVVALLAAARRRRSAPVARG